MLKYLYQRWLAWRLPDGPLVLETRTVLARKGPVNIVWYSYRKPNGNILWHIIEEKSSDI